MVAAENAMKKCRTTPRIQVHAPPRTAPMPIKPAAMILGFCGPNVMNAEVRSSAPAIAPPARMGRTSFDVAAAVGNAAVVILDLGLMIRSFRCGGSILGADRM